MPIKDSVPEIGLGNRANPSHRPGSGQSQRLLRLHLCGMDQAPARIDGHMIEKPTHGSGAQNFDHFPHLADLFCGMYMDWPIRGEAERQLHAFC